jgi:hypothetical protein
MPLPFHRFLNLTERRARRAAKRPWKSPGRPRSLALEKLEDRTLLSIVLNNGVLTVTANTTSSAIALALSDSGAVGVTLDGQQQNFSAGQVTSIVVDGLGGTDSLTANDTATTAGHTYTLTPGGVTRSGAQPITYTGITNLVLDAGNFGNTIDWQGDASGVTDTAYGGTGVNTINFGDANSTLNSFNGTPIFQGQGSNNTVNVFDEGNTTARHYVLTETALSPNGGAGFSYGYDEQVTNIYLGTGGNTLDWQGTAAGDTVTVYTGTGTNTVNLGDANKTLDSFLGTPILQGQGNTSATVIDQNSTTAHTYVITATSVTRDGSGFQLSYGGIQALTFDAGGAGNIIALSGTAAGTNTTVNAGPGGDTVYASDLADFVVTHNLNSIDLDNFHGPAVIDGQGGNTTLVVSDGFFHTYVLTSSTVSRDGSSVLTYSGVRNLYFTDGGNNVFDWQGTAAGTTTELDLVGPGDTINIGDVNHTLDGFLGTPIVAGFGQNTLNINDQGSTAPHTYSIANGVPETIAGYFRFPPTILQRFAPPAGYPVTGSSFTRDGLTLDYFGANAVNIYAGSGGDTIDWQGNAGDVSNAQLNALFPPQIFPPYIATTVYTGSGVNVVTVGDTNGTLNSFGNTAVLVGQGSNNALAVDDSESTASHAYTVAGTAISRDGFSLLYSDVQAVKLGFGTGTNTVNWQASNSAAIAYIADFNGGTDEVQGAYSASATRVNAAVAMTGSVSDLGDLTISNQGSLDLSQAPAAAVAAASVSSQGSLTGSSHLSLGDSGDFTSGNLKLVLGGTTPSSTYDQILVGGTASFTGSLGVSLVPGFTPTAGETFTIVHDTANTPVSGSFTGLPDSTTFQVGGTDALGHSLFVTFRINYVGGDVVLTDTQTIDSGSTTTTVTPSANPSTYGNAVTFTATVAPVVSAAGTPTGTVTFWDGTTVLGTGTLSGGSASYTTSALAAGGHSITASYGGDSYFFTSTSAVLTQTVNQRTLLIAAVSTSKTEGNTLTFAGTEFTTAGTAATPGLVNGDTVTSVTLTSAGAAASAVDGSYAIVPGAAVGTGLSNYAITYVPGTLTVTEPAIVVTATPLAPINEGDPSAAVEVATFTHANGVEPAGNFTVTVNWGIAGHTADPATVTEDGANTYHVSAIQPVFAEGGGYTALVSVTENDSGNASIARNFAGMNMTDVISANSTPTIPPDQGSAVGPDYYMELVNLTYAIYGKDGSVAVPPTALSTFFSNAGLVSLPPGRLGDPRLVYDQSSGRWFAVVITVDTPTNFILLAVSQTSDPTGAWKAVSFQANTTANNFGDFPTIGVDQNALYITTNDFLNDDPNEFQGVSLTSIPKADLVKATGPDVSNRSHFENIVGGGTPNTTPATLAPISDFGSRDHGVFLATDAYAALGQAASVLHRYTLGNPASASSSLSTDSPISVPTYYIGQNAHQPDGSLTLDGTNFTIGSNNVYQVGNILWAAQSIRTSAATGSSIYDSIRWYEIDETSNTLLQTGLLSDAHHDYTYPSIAANAAGDVVIGFTASGDSTTTDFPGSWYVSGTTAAGVTTFGAPQVLRNGSNNYFIDFGFRRNRWGDFSAVSVDPGNPNAFWIAEEVAAPPNGYFAESWGTQISELVFSNTASATDTLTVNEPPIVGTSANLAAIVTGQPSAPIEMATFTHANGVEPAGGFTATVNWGIAGDAADPATVTEDSNGTYHVSASRPVFTAGTYTVMVSISEDNASTIVTDTQAVNPAATTTAVTSSANPSALGGPLTFKATVSATAPGGGTPTGTVTFLDGATTVGSGTLSGGTATFTTSGLAFGSHSITASYGGDGNYTTSTSAALTQTVKIGTSTEVASSVNPSVFGQTVTFTAAVAPTSGTGTPTGTVTFFDGAATLGTATLSNGKATFSTSALAAAGHAITADYGGDGTFLVSISPVLTQTVNEDASKTAMTLSANSVVYGQSVTFTATVTAASPGAGTPSGTVTFLDGTTTLGMANLVGGSASFSTTALAVGSHAIAASYGGDSSFAASASSGKALTVKPDGTTTTLTSLPNPSTFGQSVIFIATVTVNSPGGGVPGGTVTFKDGQTTLGTATLNASGVAIFTTSSLSLGSHSITAGYGGSVNYKTSTSATLMQVVNTTGAAAIPGRATASPPTASPNSLAASVVQASTPTGPAPATFGATIGTPAVAGAAPSPLVAQGTTSVSTNAVAAGPAAVSAGTGSEQPGTAALDQVFARFGSDWLSEEEVRGFVTRPRRRVGDGARTN